MASMSMDSFSFINALQKKGVVLPELIKSISFDLVPLPDYTAIIKYECLISKDTLKSILEALVETGY